MEKDLTLFYCNFFGWSMHLQLNSRIGILIENLTKQNNGKKILVDTLLCVYLIPIMFFKFHLGMSIDSKDKQGRGTCKVYKNLKLCWQIYHVHSAGSNDKCLMFPSIKNRTDKKIGRTSNLWTSLLMVNSHGFVVISCRACHSITILFKCGKMTCRIIA